MYHFGAALSAAGGMITAIKVLTKVVSLIFLEIYSFKCFHKSNCLANCLVTFHLTINFILLIACLIVPIILSSLILPHYPTLQFSDILRGMFILYTLFVLSWIPWRYFVLDDGDRHEEIENEHKLCGEFDNSRLIVIIVVSQAK